MATATGVSLEEYLASSYQPDREYIDGELRERNLGQGPHSYTQSFLLSAFVPGHKRLGVIPLVEQRVQVSPTHFRVPDVCIIRKEDFASIIQRPPLLCVEIVSSEDRWKRLQESIDDYLRFGVPEVCVDPEARQAWTCTPDHGLRLVTGETLHWRDLSIDRVEILPPRE